MRHDIVVIGGGPGGLLTANLLARRLRPDEARIVLVDLDGRHVYRPGFLFLALDRADSRWLARDIRRLLRNQVELRVERATHLDPVAGRLHLERSGSIPFDTAVLATGARLDIQSVPGFADGAHEFYSLTGAERLREALRTWDGGRLVVGIAGMPYSCPPAPVEFALLLEDHLRRTGARSRTELTFVSPINRAFSIAPLDAFVSGLLAERGIDVRTRFDIEQIDAAGRRLHSLDGETIDYELAVLVPPHAGASIVVNSGLGDTGGWVPTDPSSLEVPGFEGVFAQGDATDLLISKSGSTAHFESPVIVERIVSRIRNTDPDPKRASFSGKVVCLFETGRGRASILRLDYESAPRVRRPSRLGKLATWAFHRAYWLGVPQGRFTR
ncbi:MAG TPA: FAD-dependent oxidoreductase [Acidimicrobiia bacterium]|nr:FAD-dependent oxidoreductase [Acidimicrobiia bacterium]